MTVTIPGRAWEHMEHLSNKVRNVIRRGYLKKTYNDGKMLKGRTILGEEIESDNIDIVHPVGYVSHVKPGDKCETLSCDVGADASRRIVLMVMGDREEHPQPDEGEAFHYAPGNKKQFIRHKKKSDQGGGGGGGAGRTLPGVPASEGQSEGRTKDSGRVAGMHWDGDDQKVSGQNKETFQLEGEKGIGCATDANFDIKAQNATQFEAGKHVRKGTTYRDGDTYTQGIEHASDHIAGGGASVGSLPSARVPLVAGGAGNGLPENTPDGSQSMSASGQPGNISLKGMAAAMGMSSVSSSGEGPPTGGGMKAEMQQMQQQQQQDRQQQQEKNDELLRRIIRIEDHLGIGPPP